MKIDSLILKITLIINFQLLIFNCFAQSDSLEVHTIKGKDYYIHIIEKGQSLYFLHTEYNVPLASSYSLPFWFPEKTLKVIMKQMLLQRYT